MSVKNKLSLFLRTAVRTAGLVIVAAVVLWLNDSLFSDKARNNSPASSTQQSEQAQFTSRTFKDYSEARKVFWRELYPDQFVTLYCGEQYDDLPRSGVNIEHVFPMGWVTNSLNCGTRSQCRGTQLFDLIESDLHNLYPSRSDVNTARSSYRFGEIGGEVRDFGKNCDFEASDRQRVVEPRPEVRGDIARAMFYMVWRYPEANLQIFDKQADLLRHWHKADPPSQSERERNARIESLQGNRNPFVDDPSAL